MFTKYKNSIYQVFTHNILYDANVVLDLFHYDILKPSFSLQISGVRYKSSMYSSYLCYDSKLPLNV